MGTVELIILTHIYFAKNTNSLRTFWGKRGESVLVDAIATLGNNVTDSFPGKPQIKDSEEPCTKEIF